MNLQRAVQILAKFFAVNPEIFKTLSKETLIEWGNQLHTDRDHYKLTRGQHAFLVGEIRVF